MTITLAGWWIPLLITIVCFVYALFVYTDTFSGVFDGLGNMLMLVPASIVSMLVWMVYAFCK